MKPTALFAIALALLGGAAALRADEAQAEPAAVTSIASTPGTGQSVTIGGLTQQDGSVAFGLSGEFLVTGWDNANWRYTMDFGGDRTFSAIVLDVDFVRGVFGPGTDENYAWSPLYYCIFYLNISRSWDDMIAYPNLLEPEGTLWNETNAGGYWQPGSGQYGLQVRTFCPTIEGHLYHLHFEYDTTAGGLSFRLTEGGQTICQLGSDVGISEIQTSSPFIEFGTSYAPEGPEGWTLGWRFRDLRIQWLDGGAPPPPPTGQRPRRRH